MYKRILVPLDGSNRAEQILGHVEGLALANRSLVILLQVVQPEIISDGYKSVMIRQTEETNQRRQEEVKGYLSKIASKLRQKGINTQIVVEAGAVVATILRVAQSEKAELIAMASHGRTGLARVFYGSVAAGILQMVDRPLLLVRSRSEE